jgi:hypothetical protein
MEKHLMKNRNSCFKPRSLFKAIPLVVAALTLGHATSAQAYTDLTVAVDPASPNDHTAVIQTALNNTSYDRVILPYRSAGWISRMLYIDHAVTLWIKGSGSTPGKLVAKRRVSTDTPTSSSTPFRNSPDSLITIRSSNVHINGYSDFVNKSTGTATVQMWKTDYANPTFYTASQYRHGIRVVNNFGAGSFSNISVKGVLVKDTGGDGVNIDGGEFGTNYIVHEVTTDNTYRNGMSVISADTLTITDSVFRNSNGSSPEAGIDFEPNAQVLGDDPNTPLVEVRNQSRLTNIKIWDSIFEDNAQDGVQVQMMNYRGTGIPAKALGIYFYRCVIDDNAEKGVQLSSLETDGPGSGTVYFQGCTISDNLKEGVYVSVWNAGQARITFNTCTLTNNAMSSSSLESFYVTHSNFQGLILGNILFQNGCIINDNHTNRLNVMASASAYSGAHTDEIRGDVTINHKSQNPNFAPVYWFDDNTTTPMTWTSNYVGP